MWLHCIQKGNSSNIHNVVKYLTIRLSCDNITTEVSAHCAFVLKTIQNFVDIDACKQVFVLNSYKSVIKKIGNKKIMLHAMSIQNKTHKKLDGSQG